MEAFFHFKAPLWIAGDDGLGKQELTATRQATVCTWWDDWRSQGLTNDQIAESLTIAGLPTSGSMVRKIAENLGL